LDGVDSLVTRAATGRGFLLFGAHFGSFEALRALAVLQCPVAVRVLMRADHAAKMNRVLQALCEDLQRQVIALGRPQTMLEVRAALAAGEMVALLADRALNDDRRVDCDFLGSAAGFPRGPFELAAVLDAPVVLFSATYRGRGRYEIGFERFDSPAEARARSVIDDRCRALAAWLETRCRAAPYNWFNFYDFWAPAGGAAPR
jgi:predicted LPLAT superfamily acyltransferase